MLFRLAHGCIHTHTHNFQPVQKARSRSCIEYTRRLVINFLVPPFHGLLKSLIAKATKREKKKKKKKKEENKVTNFNSRDYCQTVGTTV